MKPKGEKNCKMCGILSKSHGVQYPLGTGKVQITSKEAHHQFTIRTTWNFEPNGFELVSFPIKLNQLKGQDV